MKRWKIGLLILAACATAAPSRATEKTWEFGIDPGMIYPVSGGQFGHSIDNNTVRDMLNTAGEGIAEEIVEGYTLPPQGNSTVASSMPPLAELAAHLDWRVDDLLTVGLQGGWGFKRHTMIDKQGIYDQRFLILSDEAWMLHAAPVVRVGRTIGSLRPMLTFGPEYTVIFEQESITFTDPDDAIAPHRIVDQNNGFFGLVGGASLEWRCAEYGALQAGVAYHKVFAPGGKFDYVTPQLSFVARF
jgi:hypothetical protein